MEREILDISSVGETIQMKLCKKHGRTLDVSYSKHLYRLFYEENCDSVVASIGNSILPQVYTAWGSSRET